MYFTCVHVDTIVVAMVALHSRSSAHIPISPVPPLLPAAQRSPSADPPCSLDRVRTDSFPPSPPCYLQRGTAHQQIPPPQPLGGGCDAGALGAAHALGSRGLCRCVDAGPLCVCMFVCVCVCRAHLHWASAPCLDGQLGLCLCTLPAHAYPTPPPTPAASQPSARVVELQLAFTMTQLQGRLDSMTAMQLAE